MKSSHASENDNLKAKVIQWAQHGYDRNYTQSLIAEFKTPGQERNYEPIDLAAIEAILRDDLAKSNADIEKAIAKLLLTAAALSSTAHAYIRFSYEPLDTTIPKAEEIKAEEIKEAAQEAVFYEENEERELYRQSSANISISYNVPFAAAKQFLRLQAKNKLAQILTDRFMSLESLCSKHLENGSWDPSKPRSEILSLYLSVHDSSYVRTPNIRRNINNCIDEMNGSYLKKLLHVIHERGSAHPIPYSCLRIAPDQADDVPRANTERYLGYLDALIEHLDSGLSFPFNELSLNLPGIGNSSSFDVRYLGALLDKLALLLPLLAKLPHFESLILGPELYEYLTYPANYSLFDVDILKKSTILPLVQANEAIQFKIAYTADPRHVSHENPLYRQIQNITARRRRQAQDKKWSDYLNGQALRLSRAPQALLPQVENKAVGQLSIENRKVSDSKVSAVADSKQQNLAAGQDHRQQEAKRKHKTGKSKIRQSKLRLIGKLSGPFQPAIEIQQQFQEQVQAQEQVQHQQAVQVQQAQAYQQQIEENIGQEAEQLTEFKADESEGYITYEDYVQEEKPGYRPQGAAMASRPRYYDLLCQGFKEAHIAGERQLKQFIEIMLSRARSDEEEPVSMTDSQIRIKVLNQFWGRIADKEDIEAQESSGRTRYFCGIKYLSAAALHELSNHPRQLQAGLNIHNLPEDFYLVKIKDKKGQDALALCYDKSGLKKRLGYTPLTLKFKQKSSQRYNWTGDLRSLLSDEAVGRHKAYLIKLDNNCLPKDEDLLEDKADRQIPPILLQKYDFFGVKDSREEKNEVKLADFKSFLTLIFLNESKTDKAAEEKVADFLRTYPLIDKFTGRSLADLMDLIHTQGLAGAKVFLNSLLRLEKADPRLYQHFYEIFIVNSQYSFSTLLTTEYLNAVEQLANLTPTQKTWWLSLVEQHQLNTQDADFLELFKGFSYFMEELEKRHPGSLKYLPPICPLKNVRNMPVVLDRLLTVLKRVPRLHIQEQLAHLEGLDLNEPYGAWHAAAYDGYYHFYPEMKLSFDQGRMLETLHQEHLELKTLETDSIPAIFKKLFSGHTVTYEHLAELAKYYEILYKRAKTRNEKQKLRNNIDSLMKVLFHRFIGRAQLIHSPYQAYSTMLEALHSSFSRDDEYLIKLHLLPLLALATTGPRGCMEDIDLTSLIKLIKDHNCPEHVSIILDGLNNEIKSWEIHPKLNEIAAVLQFALSAITVDPGDPNKRNRMLKELFDPFRPFSISHLKIIKIWSNTNDHLSPRIFSRLFTGFKEQDSDNLNYLAKIAAYLTVNDVIEGGNVIEPLLQAMKEFKESYYNDYQLFIQILANLTATNSVNHQFSINRLTAIVNKILTSLKSENIESKVIINHAQLITQVIADNKLKYELSEDPELISLPVDQLIQDPISRFNNILQKIENNEKLNSNVLPRFELSIHESKQNEGRQKVDIKASLLQYWSQLSDPFKNILREHFYTLADDLIFYTQFMSADTHRVGWDPRVFKNSFRKLQYSRQNTDQYISELIDWYSNEAELFKKLTQVFEDAWGPHFNLNYLFSLGFPGGFSPAQLNLIFQAIDNRKIKQIPVALLKVILTIGNNAGSNESRDNIYQGILSVLKVEELALDTSSRLLALLGLFKQEEVKNEGQHPINQVITCLNLLNPIYTPTAYESIVTVFENCQSPKELIDLTKQLNTLIAHINALDQPDQNLFEEKSALLETKEEKTGQAKDTTEHSVEALEVIFYKLGKGKDFKRDHLNKITDILSRDGSSDAKKLFIKVLIQSCLRRENDSIEFLSLGDDDLRYFFTNLINFIGSNANNKILADFTKLYDKIPHPSFKRLKEFLQLPQYAREVILETYHLDPPGKRAEIKEREQSEKNSIQKMIQTKIADFLNLHRKSKAKQSLSTDDQDKLKSYYNKIDSYRENPLEFPADLIIPDAYVNKSVEALEIAEVQELIGLYKQYFRNADHRDEDLEKAKIGLLALLRDVLYRNTGNLLNYTQMLTILNILFVQGGKNLVAEISTGEGKTYEAAIFAAIKCIMGSTVNVTTVNPALAISNYEDCRDFYEYLGLKVRYLTEQSPLDAYQEGDIHYATIANLGLHEQKRFLSGMSPISNIFTILDEFDFALEDPTKFRSSTNLSNQPLNFELIYSAILRFVKSDNFQNDKGEDSPEDDVANLKAFVHNNTALPEIEKQAFANFVKHFQNADALLDLWIDSAATALSLKENEDYVIDPNDHIIKEGEKVPVQTIQVVNNHRKCGKNTKFSFGLHGILAVYLNSKKKPGEPEFLVEPDESCLAVRKADNILFAHIKSGGVLGLTGTAGTFSTISRIHRIFGLKYIKAPTHKPLRRIDHPPLLVKTPNLENLIKSSRTDLIKAAKAAYFAAIYKKIIEFRDQNRAILVVCESTEMTKELFEFVKRRDGSENQVQICNVTSTNEPAVLKKAQESGQVTISTEMLARGSDIKKTKLEVIGAHIMSEDDENQLKGRAGRYGEEGGYTPIISDAEVYLKYKMPPPSNEAELNLAINKIRARIANEKLQTYLQLHYLSRVQGHFLDHYTSYRREIKNKLSKLFQTEGFGNYRAFWSGRDGLEQSFHQEWSKFLQELDNKWREILQNEPYFDPNDEMSIDLVFKIKLNELVEHANRSWTILEGKLNGACDEKLKAYTSSIKALNEAKSEAKHDSEEEKTTASVASELVPDGQDDSKSSLEQQQERKPLDPMVMLKPYLLNNGPDQQKEAWEAIHDYVSAELAHYASVKGKSSDRIKLLAKLQKFFEQLHTNSQAPEDKIRALMNEVRKLAAEAAHTDYQTDRWRLFSSLYRNQASSRFRDCLMNIYDLTLNYLVVHPDGGMLIEELNSLTGKNGELTILLKRAKGTKKLNDEVKKQLQNLDIKLSSDDLKGTCDKLASIQNILEVTKASSGPTPPAFQVYLNYVYTHVRKLHLALDLKKNILASNNQNSPKP